VPFLIGLVRSSYQVPEPERVENRTLKQGRDMARVPTWAKEEEFDCLSFRRSSSMRREIRPLLSLFSLVILVATTVIVGSSALFAQEEKAKPAAKPTAKPTAGPDAAAAYAAKLAEWKGLLKEMRDLQADFSDADEAKADQIRTRWNEVIARVEAMIPELRTAGMNAYAAAPQQDRELERFLVTILEDDMKFDRYEEAAVLSQTLLDNGCERDEVYRDAGMAALAINDYDTAERCLKKAEDEAALTGKAADLYPQLEQYKAYWEEEKQIREEEAAAGDLPRVKISTTAGDMVVELFENQAPETVGNFISLVESKFYDGLTFHRVLENFMAQGGCPNGDGTGGPGYQIFCECNRDDYRKHFRGTLSMAHSGTDTGGSQFFITFLPTPHLNGRHTAFGRVVEGMDVLAKLQRIDPDAEGDKPEPDKILKMEVLRKRDHEYKPNKVQ
jgi:cyclophilin family peptidyl-prolyl cis-trans isomerase